MLSLTITHKLCPEMVINILTYVLCSRLGGIKITKEIAIKLCKLYLETQGSYWAEVKSLEEISKHPDFKKFNIQASGLTRKYFPQLFEKESVSITTIKILEGENYDGHDCSP